MPFRPAPDLTRLVCRLLGHDWRRVESDDEASPTGLNIHEAPTGAAHDVCARCGELRVREPQEPSLAE